MFKRNYTTFNTSKKTSNVGISLPYYDSISHNRTIAFPRLYNKNYGTFVFWLIVRNG